jgi:hypothetical protein
MRSDITHVATGGNHYSSEAQGQPRLANSLAPTDLETEAHGHAIEANGNEGAMFLVPPPLSPDHFPVTVTIHASVHTNCYLAHERPRPPKEQVEECRSYANASGAVRAALVLITLDGLGIGYGGFC